MGYAAMKMINVILLCVLLAGCAKIHAQDSGGATVVPWLHVYGATVGQCYKATETTVLAPVPCWQPHAQEQQNPHIGDAKPCYVVGVTGRTTCDYGYTGQLSFTTHNIVEDSVPFDVPP